MLIKSKFRDYYDACQGYGIDKSVVYQRTTEEYEHPYPSKTLCVPRKLREAVIECDSLGMDLDPHHRVHSKDSSTGLRDVWRMALGFCGEVHQVVVASRCHPLIFHGQQYSHEYRRSIYLSRDDMPEDVIEHLSSWWRPEPLFLKKPVSKLCPEIFVELNTPVFLVSSGYLVINPCLKDLGFSKFKGGVEAFQEISAFISGTLREAGQMKSVATDEDLIKAHGFDKFSFRKGKKE